MTSVTDLSRSHHGSKRRRRIFVVNQATRCTYYKEIYYEEIYCKDNNSVIYLAIPPESLECYKTPWTDRKAD